MISIKLCKKRLANLWFAGGPLLFVVMVLQSVFGKYGAHLNEAWAWFLPTVMPTLMLIIGVLSVSDRGAEKPVEQFVFRLAFGLSALYLCLVALILFAQPFTPLKPLELMKQSNIWLGPLQGLVAAALGIFFVKSERR